MKRRARPAPPVRIALQAGHAVPLHKQIGEQLRRAILERRLAPGTRLPSSRLMAFELHCARGTVLAAIDQLIAEGYLVSRSASGIFVASNLPDDMLARPGADARTRNTAHGTVTLPQRTRRLLGDAPGATAGSDRPSTAFPLGQPDRQAFPFPLWAKLLEQEWRRPGWHLAAAPHAFGHPGLRAAIASYLGVARGFACDPQSVVVTTGVRQSVRLVARIVLDAGDAAWIEEPGYVGLREALAAADVTAVPVPVDDAGFSPDAATTLAPHARLAVVTPSHQFPLGTVLTLQRRLALLRWAERSGGWIVEDDFDGEYRYSGRPLAPLRALDRSGRVAYLGSFSKLLFPALRLSFLVLPETLVPVTEAIMTRLTTPAPLLGQGALARFIADGHFGVHLRRTRLLYARRQQAVTAAADAALAGLMTIAPDGGGMHLLATPHGDAAARFDDVAATAAAAAMAVQVAPLSGCYRGLPKRHGLLLGYAGTPDADIPPAMTRLQKALHRR